MMEADPACRPIRKTRYCLVDDAHAFEVDFYPGWADKAILQAEVNDPNAEGINPDQSLNAAYANNGYRPQQTGNNYSRTGQSGGKNSKRASAGSIVKLIVLIIVMMVLSRIFFSACGYCLSTGCSDFGSGSSGGYDSGYSWDSGGSDWGSDW